MISNLKYMVIDVDGTLTDGGIYYDNNGNEFKKFNTKDAAGIFALQKMNIKVIVITGRECNATMRRLEELKIDHVFQNIKDKKTFLANFMNDNGISKEKIGYIGDDLNDYASMQLVNFIGCPNDACSEIKKISNCISDKNGGFGAVRDIIEKSLKSEGKWDEVIKNIYNIGI